MKIWKILIGVSILFIVIGTVTAANIDDLKVPIGYQEESTGLYYLNTDEDSHIYIGEMSLNEGIFENDTGYTVLDIGNNTYFYCDTALQSTGVQEQVVIDGEKYLVSFYKDDFIGNMQDTEIKMFIEDMEDFNKLNNLEPVEV